MKRFSFAMLLLISLSTHVTAQWTYSGSDITTSGVNNVYVPNQLSVGWPAGLSLTDYLTVRDNISILPFSPISTSELRGNNYLNSFNLYGATSISDGPYISMSGTASVTPGLMTLGSFLYGFHFDLTGPSGPFMTALAVNNVGLSINPTFPGATKNIYGTCNTLGSLGVYANNNSSDGAGMTLWGTGQVDLTSYVSGSNDRFDFNLTVPGNPVQTLMAIDPGGYISLKPTYHNIPKIIYGTCTQPNSALILCANTPSGDGSSLSLWGSGNGTVDLRSYQPTQTAYAFSIDNGSGPTTYMAMSSTGQVVIGTSLYSYFGSFNLGTNPNDYNLYVSKGILTEKLKVAISTTADWSDYVFNNNYKLMPLSKVESFVNEHKHLPEVPSAKDVADNGIDVASMDAKLLQKIEELTLYVIQQQKEIEELKKEVKNKNN